MQSLKILLTRISIVCDNDSHNVTNTGIFRHTQDTRTNDWGIVVVVLQNGLQ